VSAPACVIRFELEQSRPVVYFEALHEGERDRLLDWLRAHPTFEDVVARACKLLEEEPAA
jgi:hypothetical protein